MFIINCKDFLQGANSIREIFIQLCDGELIRLQKDNSLGLHQVLNKFDISDIKRAFRNITINEYGSLVVPDNTEAEFILRYLEYGGEDVRPTHLISSAKTQLVNTLSLERR